MHKVVGGMRQVKLWPERRSYYESEATAAAREISMDATEAAVLSELDNIFILEKKNWKLFLVDNVFCDFSRSYV